MAQSYKVFSVFCNSNLVQTSSRARLNDHTMDLLVLQLVLSPGAGQGQETEEVNLECPHWGIGEYRAVRRGQTRDKR